MKCRLREIWRVSLAVLACLVLALGLATALPFPGKAAAQEIKTFTILHTNDEHSELIPYGPASDYPTYPTTGGFSRIAHAIGGVKAQKEVAGEPVLTLGAGDFTQGTLYSALEPFLAPELVLLQDMGYDALALGNHEFDLTPDFLASELDVAKGQGVRLPLLCSNIEIPPTEDLFSWLSETDLGGSELKIQRYTIKTLSNGLKVGIFGLLGVEAEVVSNAKPVTFGNTSPLDEEASFLNRVNRAQQMVSLLRAAGCDVVVALSHCGVSEETRLAEMVSGIDVIVGGHSHDLVYPPMVIGNTIYAQAGAYGAYLGVLELQYENGRVSLRNGFAVKIDQNIATDPDVDTTIGQYTTLLDGYFNGVLGQKILDPLAETDLDGDGGFNLYDYPPYQETNLGDLITDAYLDVANSLSAGEPVNMAFEANGVIRSSLPKGGLGRFSFYDLHRTIPLGASATDTSMPGYSMVAFYFRGSEVWEALNSALDLGMNDAFLQTSGARYSCNLEAPEGSKILTLQVESADGVWEEVKKDATLYRVATTFYTASFMSFFGLKPRDASGTQGNLADFIVVKPDTKELRGWEALLEYVRAMPDLDGDGLPNVPSLYRSGQGRIQSPGWYLAEGSTAGGMETWVLVQNPTAEEAKVNIKFQTDKGEVAPQELQGKVIAANTRQSFLVNDYVPDNYNVSTFVETLQGGVVCERAMYGDSRRWAHDSIGVNAPAAEWYLAEGSTAGGMETWVLVQNPSHRDVRVNISFQTDAGRKAPDALQGVTIPAASRRTFFVNDYVPNNYNVSTLVEAVNGGVVCERAMYGDSRRWAHDSIGVTSPSRTWYLAEGSTAGGMETFVLVQNPTASDVKVNLKFQTDAGEKAPDKVQGVTIRAQSRETFKVNDYVPDNYNVSTLVETLQGVVVCERAMYGGNRTWAHDSIGYVPYAW